jgi:hypothetical protein
MIILDATNKSLQIKLDAAITTNQLPFSASYVDSTSTATTPGEQDGASNSTTAVDAVSSPASSTQRLVKSVALQNADTAAAKVYVIYKNNATSRNILVVTLAPGDQLIYEDGEGWSCLDSNGEIKTTGGFNTDAWTSYNVPTPTSGSGMLSSASATGRYKTIGKTCFVELSVNITTNGSGGTNIVVALPFTAAAHYYTLAGVDVGVTGKMLYGFINQNGTTALITFYDNTYPGANSAILQLSGVYEIA